MVTDTQTSSRISTTSNETGNNTNSKDAKLEKEQSTDWQPDDELEPSKCPNKEDSKVTDQNKLNNLGSRTEIRRTSKSQRKCPKTKNEDFLWN